MNKLREKFENVNLCDRYTDAYEQITDDFSVRLLVWMVNLNPKNDELKHIDYENSSDEEIATELLQIFKDNIYGSLEK